MSVSVARVLLPFAMPLLLLGSADAKPPASAQEASLFVNTSVDVPFDQEHCQPGRSCPLRSAIALADGGVAVVRACYDPAEVGGGPGCPGDAEPLRTSDPGYDPESGKWFFEMEGNLISYELDQGGTTIDFTRDIGGWDGPEDNRIVITATRDQNFALVIDSSDNVLMGFEIRGRYLGAGIAVRIGASNNQLGPGLILAGIDEGVGIQIRDRGSDGNRLVGSWCGITGDGTEVMALRDDCVQIVKGARNNVVGGPDPADRNVLSASTTGAGVSVDDSDGLGTGAATIQGNWIGLDATGAAAAGSQTGVRIVARAHENLLEGNVISGNEGSGITITDATYRTIIQDNIIGANPTGELPLGNGGYGIKIQGLVKETLVSHNRIWFNHTGGIRISGGNARNNLVTENSISANSGHALDVVKGANAGLRPPQIGSVTDTEIIGQACGGCEVEIFSDPSGEAAVFEGRAKTDVAVGLFTFSKPEGFTYRVITATSIDMNGNTSGLSRPWYPPDWPTPTPTGGPEPTEPSALHHRIHLPWLGRAALR